MKGYIHLAAFVGLLASAATSQAQSGTCASGTCGSACATVGSKGKTGYNCNDLYDRCWFVRYSSLAHRSVNRAMTPQVQNGHVLDQTVWNHMFEPGTDVLNPMGQAHLQYISRRRPEADRTVYLATALDLKYDPACPERFCGARQELDSLRVAAVQKYLVGLNCGRCPDFQVLVHDPADVTLHSAPVSSSVIQMYARFRGGLATGGGGAAGPTGSVGGFAGAGGAASR